MRIGTRDFDCSQIEYIKLTRECSSLPVSGIITSKLQIRLLCGEPFSAGEEIYIYGENDTPVLPVFYISKPGYGDGVTEITAYDNCRALECIFDTGGAFSEERDYDVTMVLQRIASLCGFSGYAASGLHIDSVPYRYLEGKTCRSILMLLSETGCGTWFCNLDNRLEFRHFGAVTDFCTLDDTNCSNFRRGAVRGPVSAVRVINPVSGDDYQLGYAESFKNILKVKGKLIDSSTARSILEDVSDTVYRAFSCKNAVTDVIPEALCGFIHDDICYFALSIVTNITPFGCVSTVRAPVISEDRYDYAGSVEYLISDLLAENKRYGTTVISRSGLEFNDGDDGKYGFDVRSDGVTLYEGKGYSKTPASGISVSDNADTVEFDVGGVKNILSLVWNGDILRSYSRVIKKDGDVIFRDDEEEST